MKTIDYFSSKASPLFNYICKSENTKELLQKESPFLLIAGPCAIEGEEMAFKIAEKCIEIAKKHSIQYVFKGKFQKANRSKIDSFTGIGDIKALKILSCNKFHEVSDIDELKIPVTTDVHEVSGY